MRNLIAAAAAYLAAQLFLLQIHSAKLPIFFPIFFFEWIFESKQLFQPLSSGAKNLICDSL